jgi:hypothetical protein
VPMGTAGPGAGPVDLPVDAAVAGTSPHPLLPGPQPENLPDVQQPYVPPEPGGVT